MTTPLVFADAADFLSHRPVPYGRWPLKAEAEILDGLKSLIPKKLDVAMLVVARYINHDSRLVKKFCESVGFEKKITTKAGLMEELIQKGANPNALFSIYERKTALMFAIAANSPEIDVVDMLLRHKGDPNVCDRSCIDSWPPLLRTFQLESATKGDGDSYLKMARMLVDKGAEVRINEMLGVGSQNAFAMGTATHDLYDRRAKFGNFLARAGLDQNVVNRSQLPREPVYNGWD